MKRLFIHVNLIIKEEVNNPVTYLDTISERNVLTDARPAEVVEADRSVTTRRSIVRPNAFTAPEPMPLQLHHLNGLLNDLTN